MVRLRKNNVVLVEAILQTDPFKADPFKWCQIQHVKEQFAIIIVDI